MPNPQPLHVNRRTLARGAAWSVPVVAVATAAPAWAVSPCDLRSGTVSTTTGASTGADPATPPPGYTRNTSTSATWTSASPGTIAGVNYTNATITVSETRTSSTLPTFNIEYGFQTNDAQNLTVFNTGTVIGPTINQRPTTATSPRGFANRTITTFAFDRPVYGLTFKISDISKSSTPAQVTAENQLTAVAFWDTVWVESTATWGFNTRGTAVTGSGTQADPFTAAINADNSDQNAESDVTIAFTGAVRSFNLHYWSAIKNNITGGGSGQGITVSNMSMQLAPAACI